MLGIRRNRIDRSRTKRDIEMGDSGRKSDRNLLILPKDGVGTIELPKLDERDYMDADGKIDLDEAPAQLVAQKGLEMQYDSRKAVDRILGRID